MNETFRVREIMENQEKISTKNPNKQKKQKRINKERNKSNGKNNKCQIYKMRK